MQTPKSLRGIVRSPWAWGAAALGAWWILRPDKRSSAYDPCAHLANVRAQHAALMATGQQKAAQGMLPIIISLEEQCEASGGGASAEPKDFISVAQLEEQDIQRVWGPPPPKPKINEPISYTLWYPYSKWILGEGKAELNQWAELAGSLFAAAGTALAPVTGPIAATIMNTIGGLISNIKTKQRWVTAPPGVWELVTVVDGAPYITATVEWGREKYGSSGIIKWSGQRDSTGDLPLAPGNSSVQLYNSDDPARTYVYDGTSKSVAKNAKWIQPPGPPQPELWVGVKNGETEIMLWMPGRGGDAKDGRYYYNVDLEIG